LLKKEEEPERAEQAFRVLYRLMSVGKGRIKYPEFGWCSLDYFLEYHKDELQLRDV
jgi:hypothetical protein